MNQEYLYFVTQKIAGVKHYYSHWERLHPSSPVYGIVWNEHLCYGHSFTDEIEAKKMRSRILKYDNRVKVRVEPINKSLVKKSLESLEGMQ